MTPAQLVIQAIEDGDDNQIHLLEQITLHDDLQEEYIHLMQRLAERVATEENYKQFIYEPAWA